MKYVIIFFIVSLFYSCTPQSEQGKNESISVTASPIGYADEKSAELAANILKNMGGQNKWNETRFIAWNFFGVRDLIWDKWTGNVRIDFPRASSVYVVNVNTEEGKVWRDGLAVSHPDSLTKYLSQAKSIWINDSYWLAMPFKLRDKGVALTYVGEDTTAMGASSNVLEMTFKEVGDTPNNKYHIHVTKSDGLIKQWEFFKNANMDKPSAVWPWDNYKNFDGLLLSGDRSDGKGPKNIKVYKDLPKEAFQDMVYALPKG